MGGRNARKNVGSRYGARADVLTQDLWRERVSIRETGALINPLPSSRGIFVLLICRGTY